MRRPLPQVGEVKITLPSSKVFFTNGRRVGDEGKGRYMLRDAKESATDTELKSAIPNLQYQFALSKSPSHILLPSSNQVFVAKEEIGSGVDGFVRKFSPEKAGASQLNFAVKRYKKVNDLKAQRNELLAWNRVYPQTPAKLFTNTEDGVTTARLVMPCIVGETFKAFVAKTQKNKCVEDYLRACIAIAHELQRMHKLGVAHGDIHGGNVIMQGVGAPVLIDFCYATLAEDHMVRKDLSYFANMIYVYGDRRLHHTNKVLQVLMDPLTPVYLPICIAAMKLDLIILNKQKNCNKEESLKLINEALKTESLDVLENEIYIKLKLLEFNLQQDSVDHKKEKWLPLNKLQSEINRYHLEFKGRFRSTTDTIDALTQVMNAAVSLKLNKIPESFMTQILRESNAGNTWFRYGVYKTNRHVLFSHAADVKSEVGLSATEKVIYHLGKELKLG